MAGGDGGAFAPVPIVGVRQYNAAWEEYVVFSIAWAKGIALNASILRFDRDADFTEPRSRGRRSHSHSSHRLATRSLALRGDECAWAVSANVIYAHSRAFMPMSLSSVPTPSVDASEGFLPDGRPTAGWTVRPAPPAGAFFLEKRPEKATGTAPRWWC